jgi:hemerythrin superfamily protein
MAMRTGGAVIAGAAVGFLAGLAVSPARKALMEGAEALAGDWADVLTAEHHAVEALFDALQATHETQTARRQLLLTQIAHALNKHAIQEENVIYPALRRIDEAEARRLFSDHADIKTLLSELQYDIEKDDPRWIEKVRALALEVTEHAREEEDEVFPRMRAMGEEVNASLTRRLHWEGLKVA